MAQDNEKRRPEAEPDWRPLGPHHEDAPRTTDTPAEDEGGERPSWKPRGTEDR